MCAVRWLSVLRVAHVSTASTCSVHRMRARVRSATPQSSSPPYSIRGVVFRRGVRRGPGNFAGDPSVPSHQAHGAPPGQGPLHRTPAYPHANDKTVTERPRRRVANAPTCTRTARHGHGRCSNCASAPLRCSASPGRKASGSSTWPVLKVPAEYTHAHTCAREYTRTGTPRHERTHSCGEARRGTSTHARTRVHARARAHSSTQAQNPKP